VEEAYAQGLRKLASRPQLENGAALGYAGTSPKHVSTDDTDGACVKQDIPVALAAHCQLD